jgi:hypothetical protein
VNQSSLEGMNSRICPLWILEGQSIDHMGLDHTDPPLLQVQLVWALIYMQ